MWIYKGESEMMQVCYQSAAGLLRDAAPLQVLLLLQRIAPRRYGLKLGRAFIRAGLGGADTSTIAYCAPSVRFLTERPVVLSGGFYLHERVEFRGDAEILLGNGVRIDSNTILTASTMSGSVNILENTYIGPHCTLYSSGGLHIGKNVLIGPSTGIYAESHGIETHQPISLQKVSGKGIRIGDGVWIGSNVVILDGVTIGENSIIGAGSTVTRSCPPNSVVMGPKAEFRTSRPLVELS